MMMADAGCHHRWDQRRGHNPDTRHPSSDQPDHNRHRDDRYQCPQPKVVVNGQVYRHRPGDQGLPTFTARVVSPV